MVGFMLMSRTFDSDLTEHGFVSDEQRCLSSQRVRSIKCCQTFQQQLRLFATGKGEIAGNSIRERS